MEQFLLFYLERELFGLRIDYIQEIVESPALHYIPRAPQHYCGAINFHGNVVPVIDLAGLIGYETTARDERVVVLPLQVATLGLAFTSVGRIVSLDPEGMQPVQPDATSKQLIHGVLTSPEGMVNLLDVPQLLSNLDNS